MLVAQSCPNLCDPMDCSLPGFCCLWNSPGKKTGVDSHSLLQGDLPNTGIKPGSPTLQADSLPSEPPYMCLRPDQLEMNPEIFFCAIYFTSTWGTSTSEVEFTVIYSQDGVGSA